MATPTSIRLDASVKRRLRQRAEVGGLPASTLAQRLIDEGLRMADHPGIVFRDGPAGRRAGLARGPDVAEVIDIIHHLDATGDDAVTETSRWLEIPEAIIRTAVDYYAEFTEEIDQELERRERAAREAKERWERRQQLLA